MISICKNCQSFFPLRNLFDKKRSKLVHIQNVNEFSNSCRGNQLVGKHHVQGPNLEVMG